MLMKLAMLLVISCLLGCETQPTAAPNKISKERIFSPQELQVLQTDQPAEAVYDFSLDKEEQFRSIALQVDRDICSGIAFIPTTFKLTHQESVNLMLWYNHECPNRDYLRLPTCFPPYALTIYVKEMDSIMLNEKIVNCTALVDTSAQEMHNRKELIKRGNIIFNIKWDRVTASDKKEVLTQLIKGYLKYTNTIAEEMYQKPIDSLDSLQIAELKLASHFVFQLSDPQVPPPPPPPIKLIPED